MAFAKAVEYADLTDVLIAADEKGKVPFLVLLDGLEDVHNVGAIIRTAECAGADAVLLPKRRSAPINETVGKSRLVPLNTCLWCRSEYSQTLKRTQKTGVLGDRRRYGGGNRLLPQLFDRSRRSRHRKRRTRDFPFGQGDLRRLGPDSHVWPRQFSQRLRSSGTAHV